MILSFTAEIHITVTYRVIYSTKTHGEKKALQVNQLHDVVWG